MQNLIDTAGERQVPGESAGKLACPFRAVKRDSESGWCYSVAKLQTADWLHMAGPLGIFYISQSDLHERYKRLFCQTLEWLRKMRRHTQSRSELVSNEVYSLQTYWWEQAVALEYLMPVNFLVFNLHLCQHVAEDVVRHGPVRSTWMFALESENGWIKRSLKSGKSPLEGVAREQQRRWRNTLAQHRHPTDKTHVQRLDYLALHLDEDRHNAAPLELLGTARTPEDTTRMRYNVSNSDARLIYRYLLETDPVLKTIDDVYAQRFPREGTQPDLRTYQWTDATMVNDVNAALSERLAEGESALADRFPVGPKLSARDLRTICQGPVCQGPDVDKYIQVHRGLRTKDTNFCVAAADARRVTCNSYFPFPIEGYTRWFMAQIERIYHVKRRFNHPCARGEFVLLRIHLYMAVREDNVLQLYRRVTDTQAIKDSLPLLVRPSQLPDYNAALWKYSQTNLLARVQIAADTEEEGGREEEGEEEGEAV